MLVEKLQIWEDWQGNFSDILKYELADSKTYMDSNRIGREGGKSDQVCYQVCSPYIVSGINQRYLKNGSR